MAIDPLKAGGLRNGQTAGRLEGAKPRADEPASGQARPASVPAGDTVELSPVSRAIATPGADGATGADPSLPPDRMRQVLDRIATDYYDRPEVLDRIAEAVADDLRRGAGS